jgi:hypothetical protein
MTPEVLAFQADAGERRGQAGKRREGPGGGAMSPKEFFEGYPQVKYFEGIPLLTAKRATWAVTYRERCKAETPLIYQ